MIDSAPEIVLHPVDLHEHLVEVPASMPETPHRLDAAAPDLRGKDGAETVPPEPNRLMCDIDAPLVQQILDVPQRERIPDIHHHREADDLGRGLEVAEDAGVAHPVRLAALPASGKPIFF